MFDAVRKRTLGVLALGAAVSMALAACGGTTGTTQPSASINRTGTITIWHGWEGSYLDTKKAIFDAYMAKYPGVTIQLVHKPKLDQAVVAAVPAGQGPDIIAWVDDWVGKMAKLEIIKPLDDQVSKDWLTSTYSKPAVEAVTFDNKIYGLPETVEAISLIYNKKLIQASDIPKTSDDLLAYAKKYQQDHPGQYGIVWNAFNDAYFQAPWVYGFGGFYVKADGTVGLKEQGTKDAVKYIDSFKSVFPGKPEYGVADQLFKDGKSAMIINGPWSVADYGKAGVDYGIATLPTISSTGKPASPFVGVKTMMVSANAKNVPLAVDILKWFSNKDNQIKEALDNKEIPSNLAALADPQVKAIPQVAAFGAQVANGVPLPNTPYMTALWDPVSKGLEAAWTGKETADQAMNDAQTAAEKNVAQLK
jgi:arabinogalactan oligomer/maltooligosaccharide transport system substrate-binding protein